MNNFFRIIAEMLSAIGVSPTLLPPLGTLTATLAVLLMLWVIYYVLSRPLASVVNRYIAKTETQTDDILLSPAIVRSLCMLVTAWLCAESMPGLCHYYPSSSIWVHRMAYVLRIVAVTHVLILECEGICLFLRSGDNRRSGILVLRNIVKTVIVAVSTLLAISALMGKSPAYVVSALGAMAAVLMLVFKDSILGMTAGIRLTINGMLKDNDWVTVPKYNADGRVEDVSLTAVKIRNWDKSVSSIPPHALVSEGFVNREAMLELGLRQLKRTINIDINSVRRLTQSELALLPDGAWRSMHIPHPHVNLALFRRWLRTMLLDHPRRARSDEHPLQVLVREHPATEHGIPLEILFFVECPDWEEFEMLQADIADEITASISDFGLRIFQSPTGNDLHTSPTTHKPETVNYDQQSMTLA